MMDSNKTKGFLSKITLKKQIFLFCILLGTIFISHKFLDHLSTNNTPKKNTYFSHINTETKSVRSTLKNSTKNLTQNTTTHTSTFSCGGVVGGTGPNDDFDGDGVCNDEDVDDDNDGVLDADEIDVPISCNTDCSWFPTNRGRDNMLAITANGATTSLTTKYGFVTSYVSATNSIIASSGDVRLGDGLTGGLDGASAFTFTTVGDSHSNPFKGNHYFELDFTTKNFTGTYALQEINAANASAPVSIMISDNAFETSYNTLACNLTGFQNVNKLYNQSAIALLPNKTYTIRIYFHAKNTTSATIFGDDFYFSGQRNYSQSTAYSCTPTPLGADKDTDNDGIPNRLDLDSDGDGCPDAVEAGISKNILTSATVSNGSGGAVTSTTSIANALVTGTTDANNNGFLDSVENGTTGTINYNSYYKSYALNNALNSCLDSDADGLSDVIDLDDDNDGILDVEEQTYTSSILSNTGITVSSELTPSNGTSITDIVDGTTDNEFAFANASNVTNKEVIVFNLVTPEVLSSMVFQQNNTTEFIETRSSYKIQGSNNGVDWSDIKVSSVEEMNSNSLTFPFQHNKTAYLTYRLFIVSGNMSQGSYVKEVVLTKKVFADKDTDLDTIVDRLDLDADGDGCSDALEGGAALTTANLTTSAMPGGNTGGSYTGSASPVTQNISGNVDANGVPTLVAGGQTKNWSQEASINESCIDTDGDLVNNEIDLDDDNDGILDAEECSGQNFTLDLGVFNDGVNDTAGRGKTNTKTKPLLVLQEKM